MLCSIHSTHYMLQLCICVNPRLLQLSMLVAILAAVSKRKDKHKCILLCCFSAYFSHDFRDKTFWLTHYWQLLCGSFLLVGKSKQATNEKTSWLTNYWQLVCVPSLGQVARASHLSRIALWSNSVQGM